MASAAGGRMYVVETDRKKEEGIDRIMISENLRKYATEKFERRRELLAPVMPVIEEKLKQCSEEEAVLMKFLYGTMPVRDAGEYGFDLFLSYVKHALMLREKVAWCKELPEDVFVNYVLYDRINSEDITDCRPFFYEQIMGRVAGMSLLEAILEINYWCAEHATYEATDGRTASPMTMYRSGKGRCGEESTFAVTAYRSVGIAARQVYTPRWAHCDDNHAWVEVFVDGEWHFLGACEPEEVLDTGWFCAGGMLAEGRLVAVSLAEKCGGTLVNHIEKALYSHAGAYPAIVQAFAAHYGADCPWVNREDDARDKGLRTSKLQYLPAELGGKVRLEVGTELDMLRRVPTLKTERLTLTALRPGDREAYNALCLDDERNRWWGYDYRTGLGDKPLTENYFLDMAKADFAARRAVNFAVRLKGKLIGEVVLYRPDFRGGFEQGCRIAPAYAGHGYGTEAFAAAADWALYQLGLARVVAKCFKENAASHRMLASCMRPGGEDETYFYFEKVV